MGYGQNMTLTAVDFNGNVTGTSGNIGGIVGWAAATSTVSDYTTYQDVHSSGVISGTNDVGGIVGLVQYAISFEDSSSSANIVATGDRAGGFVGNASGTSDSTTSPKFNNSSASGTVEGLAATGGFVGQSDCAPTYTDVWATGDVTGTSVYAGGFVGFDGCEGPGSEYSQAYASGSVHGTDSVGGFAGYAAVSIFHQTYSSSPVVGVHKVGGLIGTSWGFGDIEGEATLVIESFSTGSVSAIGNEVGGLIGSATYTYIGNSFSRSSVNANEIQGGLVGNLDTSRVFNSYSAGLVGTSETQGGLIADHVLPTAVDFSFWDTQTSNQATSSGGTGKTTTQMYTLANYASELGEDSWDFESVWGFGDGIEDYYPCLQWADTDCLPMTETPSASDTDGVETAIENAAPNGGDANNDGTDDSSQDNVASFVNSATGEYVTLAVSESCEIDSASVGQESANSSQDGSFQYPLGMLNFVIDCGTPGISVTVEEYFYGAGSASTFVARKYTAYNDTYQTLEGAAVTDVTIGGSAGVKLVFSLTDGGQLDNDQLANGVIVDPAGLGAVANSSSGALPQTGSNAMSIALYGALFIALGIFVSFAFRKRLAS